MIRFNFEFDSEDEKIKRRDIFHKALVGSPGYVGTEIMVTDSLDGNPNRFELIVGENNDNDIAYYFKL